VFGAFGDGSLTDVYMLGYVQPEAASTQFASEVSFCITNGIIYYSFNYPMDPNDSEHYTFSTQQTNLPLVWAVGPTLGTAGNFPIHYAASSTTLTASNTPQARFVEAVTGTGTATLFITNLLVSVTNQLQFNTNLNPSTWIALTNIVVQPPCGTNMLTRLMAVKVPRTNSDTGFWRIKQ